MSNTQPDSINESIISSIQQAILFRAKNTFFGTFALSWFLFNWDRVFYFFMSDEKVLPKISLLKSELPPPDGGYSFFLKSHECLIYPLLTALIFTIGYPFLIYITKRIHKWIFAKIEKFNETTQQEAIKRRKGLESDMENSIGERNKIKARIEREIADEKLNAIISNERADEIRKELQNNKIELERIKIDIQSNTLILQNQENRKINLTDEYNQLKEDFSTVKEQNDIVKKITEKYTECEAKLKISEGKIINLEVSLDSSKRYMHLCDENYKSHIAFEANIMDKLKDYQEAINLYDRIVAQDQNDIYEKYPDLINFRSQISEIESSRKYTIEQPHVMKFDY
ncbi:hypothetical protein ACLIV7_003142 [Klebsiella pneumoniae]|uniref:hypothetical protein n=1 Tax=Klebsiella pneumoniae TaxID=573 RepID=UPI0024129710|nr:hypothetical protein [Klebsiella pneumoniae]EKL2659771.1 hypothetical protein [Klebsiella pneumoniae]ELB4538653.1 hypothetical protein [Klebsiella pneumoniae]ELB5682909.1 hypothetical protein [Klebsiella pneumoniae]EMD0837334.1 hypothetical protein [Klebsiella pneumoniae]EMD0985483.1 hypothetical protein [Klebsiella pneumoniae]